MPVQGLRRLAIQYGTNLEAEAEAEAEADISITGEQIVTLKERREAQIELIDMAITLEMRFLDDKSYPDARRLQRAKLLRDIAAELDRVPEE